MNCPNCPSPLVCPEGGVAYCTECGWGRTLESMRLHEIAEALENMPRLGDEFDDPEGRRYLQISDTLVEQIVAAIRKAPETDWQKRVGELIDAILLHRRDTPPGASTIDQKLWGEVL